MNKRKVLVSKKKLKVIREIENGKKKADICREFGLVNSKIQTNWKNRTKIISAFEQNGLRTKRLRKPEWSDVNGALIKWFKQRRSDNVPASGPLLTTKAEKFANKLSNEELVCSAVWIERFNLRHNISFGKVSGEARGVKWHGNRVAYCCVAQCVRRINKQW
jgi:transposase-like protein